MGNMLCEYQGLTCKIKKRDGAYLITSRVKREGYTNYIDVLGNEHSDIFMKRVNVNEVDIIYYEDVFIQYKDIYFSLFASQIFRNDVVDDSYMIWTRSEQVAAKYGFEKKEQFVFVKYIRKEQIESIKVVQKPIKEFEERGIKEIIIPKEEIDEWLSAIE
jgi:hypothetical protein